MSDLLLIIVPLLVAYIEARHSERLALLDHRLSRIEKDLGITE
jgi:hypothetical protein